jgi:hypothetical protein
MSIPTEERQQVARQVLVEILKESGPQLGAKLKVRLTAALGRRFGLPTDVWHALVPKLTQFLAANSDLVNVARPSGPGDILVSLRDEPGPPAIRSRGGQSLVPSRCLDGVR